MWQDAQASGRAIAACIEPLGARHDRIERRLRRFSARLTEAGVGWRSSCALIGFRLRPRGRGLRSSQS